MGSLNFVLSAVLNYCQMVKDVCHWLVAGVLLNTEYQKVFIGYCLRQTHNQCYVLLFDTNAQPVLWVTVWDKRTPPATLGQCLGWSLKKNAAPKVMHGCLLCFNFLVRIFNEGKEDRVFKQFHIRGRAALLHISTSFIGRWYEAAGRAWRESQRHLLVHSKKRYMDCIYTALSEPVAIQSALQYTLTFTHSSTHSHTDGGVDPSRRQPACQEHPGWGVSHRDTSTSN